MTLYERLEAVGTPELMCPKCGKVGLPTKYSMKKGKVEIYWACSGCMSFIDKGEPIEVVCLTRAQVDAVEKERGK